MKQDTLTEKQRKVEERDANRDPITGAPGSHPVGTGLGAAAGGAAAGAAIGTVAGPVGTAAGMVVGAIVGGLAGKGIAERMDPTVEDTYWRENYRTRAYVQDNDPYDFYQAAYRTGFEGRARYSNKKFDAAESDLQRDYEKNRGKSTLGWDKAKHAARDAWDRVERAIPGDSDRDGK